MTSIMDELSAEHQAFLGFVQEAGPGDVLPKIEEFLVQLANAGSEVGDPRQRSRLRAIGRFWSSFVYNQTGQFPEMQLLPKLESGVLSSTTGTGLAEIMEESQAAIEDSSVSSYVEFRRIRIESDEFTSEVEAIRARLAITPDSFKRLLKEKQEPIVHALITPLEASAATGVRDVRTQSKILRRAEVGTFQVRPYEFISEVEAVEAAQTSWPATAPSRPSEPFLPMFQPKAPKPSEEESTLVLGEPRRPPQQPVLAILISWSGSLKGQTFEIRKSRTTIGRGRYNDIAINEPSVSRQHALLVYEQPKDKRGFFTLNDLASTNATSVNAKRLRVKCRLKHNDIITLGEIELLFKRLDDDPKPIPSEEENAQKEK